MTDPNEMPDAPLELPVPEEDDGPVDVVEVDAPPPLIS